IEALELVNPEIAISDSLATIEVSSPKLKIEDLESVDTSNSTTIWPKFYHMISRSPNLKKLGLWKGENVDLKLIATCNPHLSHLCLSYDVKYGVVCCALYLENVSFLELGWSVLDDVFSHRVEGLIKLCPKLKKLVIRGEVSDWKSVEECKMLANFTLSMVTYRTRVYAQNSVAVAKIYNSQLTSKLQLEQ
ncbi:F-box family protein, partial [Trifolium pratense]